MVRSVSVRTRPIAFLLLLLPCVPLAGMAGAFALFGAACSSFSAADAPADAGSDVGAPADVAISTDAYCAAHTGDTGFLFCDDFELPTQGLDPFGFTDSLLTPTVTKLEVTSDGARHAVLKVTVNAPSGTAGHPVSLRQNLGLTGGGPPALQVDLDINIVTDDAATATLAALHFAGLACEAEYGLGAFDGNKLGGTRNRDVTLRPLVTGEWQHLTIQLLKDANSATGYRELTTYAGMPLVDREARAGSDGGAPTDCNGSDDLVLGVTESIAGAANVIVLFDNVLVRKL
jgi:hypothetical protein